MLVIKMLERVKQVTGKEHYHTIARLLTAADAAYGREDEVQLRTNPRCTECMSNCLKGLPSTSFVYASYLLQSSVDDCHQLASVLLPVPVEGVQVISA